MRNIFKTVVLLAGAVLFSTAAQAGTSPVLRAKVPFAFVVNGHTLPSGSYTIERDDTNPSILLIRSDKNAHALFVSTIRDSGHDPAGSKPALSFSRHEKQYKLSGVWQDNSDGWDVAAK